jgi:asparagine synthase (glutamine-hydrolysing)
MCGILGTIDHPFNESALDLLRHRGPDDGAISRRFIANRVLTLGHRRLSILDLSPAGRQPMWTPCDRFGMVFNGEIYNHLELRADMGTVLYRGHSDTETLLHHLARHGMKGLERLNGIFAFGFIDQDRSKLYLARDAFGVKPLYYWHDDRSLVFSSELSPILRFVRDDIDPAHLAELLKLRYVPSPDTLFRNIRKLRPGHVLQVDIRERALGFEEYPFLRHDNAPLKQLRPAEAVKQYGAHVQEAIKRQLLSDVKVGVLLSGGVDSALVSQIAQENSSYKLPAFTVGFSSAHEADEIDAARATARTIGLEHQHIRIGLSEFLDLLPVALRAVEEPVATTSIVPMFSLSRLAAQHVKVVLSGQGADEAMGGYRRYQIELLRSFVPSSAFALGPRVSALNIKNDTLRRAISSLAEKDDIRRFEAVYSVFSDTQIERLIGRGPLSPTKERIRYFYDHLQCSTLPHSVERMMRLDLRMSLADDLLLYTDKITMHHSLECRVPLLDRDLVRFVESLPYRHRLGIFKTKLVHKRYAATVLPASIIRAKKKGFLSPTGEWFRDSRVRDILLDPSSRFAGFFCRRSVEALLNEHAQGMRRDRHIFLLLSISLWMDQYLNGRACERIPA